MKCNVLSSVCVLIISSQINVISSRCSNKLLLKERDTNSSCGKDKFDAIDTYSQTKYGISNTSYKGHINGTDRPKRHNKICPGLGIASNVLISSILVVGLFGNTAALVILQWKGKNNSINLLLKILAVVDNIFLIIRSVLHVMKLVGYSNR